jgi:hypothetical protein
VTGLATGMYDVAQEGLNPTDGTCRSGGAKRRETLARSVKSPLSRHFSTVSARYNELRVTDSEPVDLMVRALAGRSVVTAADAGCGTGRYMVELMHRLGERLFVYFVDCNEGEKQALLDLLLLRSG